MEYRTPMTVRDLIERIGTKRAEWDDLLKQVPAGQLNQPLLEAWTVRDSIAIITWKERRLMEIIGSRAFTGLSFSELSDMEQAHILEASHALPIPSLLEEHQTTHREMLEMIQTLTDDEVNSERFKGLPPDVRFWKAIGAATWWSYPIFAKPLRQVLEKASSPEN
jgi:hypothetical protein